MWGDPWEFDSPSEHHLHPMTPAIFFTDLDGTLLDSKNRLGSENRRALEGLGLRGIPRVVATGRSLRGARGTLGEGFPVDYLIFSSGAGVVDWKTGELLVSHELVRDSIPEIWGALCEEGLSFMVHEPVPENHRFAHWRGPNPPADFLRRLERHGEFGVAVNVPPSRASQFLAVCEGERAEKTHEYLISRFKEATVVRATSPLDGMSAWLEIFPSQVSKGQTAAWLASRLGVARDRTAAVGNDFNDVDLLRWAGASYLVANAPSVLQGEFEPVSHFEAGGVAQAVAQWLDRL